MAEEATTSLSKSSAKDFMPLLPITLPRTLEACGSLKLDKNTVFICSYPKSGTTFMQNIVFHVVTKGARELDHISNYAPFFEDDKTWSFESGEAQLRQDIQKFQREIKWRMFNTHLWWSMLPKNGDAKYIYVVRNARDVCCSFYHHLSHQSVEDGGYPGSVDEFVQDWVDGRICFGSWVDHLKSWVHPERDTLAEACLDSRVLIVSFEEMKRDIRAVVKRVASHLSVTLTVDQVGAILPRLSFEYMKTHLDKFQPKSVQWLDKGDSFAFVRKGAIGDSKNLFNSEHEQLFKALLSNPCIPKSCRSPTL